MLFKDSPLILELLAQASHEFILDILEVRMGTIPPEIPLVLQGVQDSSKLSELNRLAAVCPDLATFQTRLAELAREEEPRTSNWE